MNDWLIVALLAIAPFSELRGSIPYGVLRGLPFFPVVLVSIALNIITGILVYFFLDGFVKIFLKLRFFKKFYNKVIERSQKKVHAQVEKYGWIGVALFVGIPLPITGAWTGALGSYLIGLDKRKTIISIILGVIMAAIIVSLATISGISAFSFFIKMF